MIIDDFYFDLSHAYDIEVDHGLTLCRVYCVVSTVVLYAFQYFSIAYTRVDWHLLEYLPVQAMDIHGNNTEIFGFEPVLSFAMI